MSTSCFEEANLQAVLERVLREEGFHKPHVSIENGTKPGENFVGRVFRVSLKEKMNGKEKFISLIFKASSTNRKRQELMQSGERFKCESDMYRVVLPALNDLLKKHGVTRNTVFPGTPRCFAVELNGRSKKDIADVIVLEDLKVHGFAVADRKKGFTADHCRVALQEIALLHASSMAFFATKSEAATRIKQTIGNGLCKDESAGAGSCEALIADLKRGLINGLSLLKEPYKKGNPVYDRLNRFYENFEEEFAKINATPDDLDCLSHSDCTTNNLLFKHDRDGLPTEVYLIDFQSPGNSSPVVDVSTILFMSTTKEIRDQHYDKLLGFYFDKVSETLKALNCDPEEIFPWNKFQRHLRLYGIFGVIFSLMGLPIFLADQSEICVDIHSEDGDKSLFSGTAKITGAENVERVSKRLTDAVSDAVRMGYI